MPPRNYQILTALLKTQLGAQDVISKVEDLDQFRKSGSLVAEEYGFAQIVDEKFIKRTFASICMRHSSFTKEAIVVFCDDVRSMDLLLHCFCESVLSDNPIAITINNTHKSAISHLCELQTISTDNVMLVEFGNNQSMQFTRLPLTAAATNNSLVVFSLNNKRANLTDLKLLPKRDFYFDNVRIVVRQEWVLDGRGGTELGFGSAVYPAAVSLSEYVSRLPAHVFTNKRVLELGCGTGLCGLVASKLFPLKFCLATDGDEATVQLASKNFRLNKIPSELYACEKHLWGEPGLFTQEFDIILACDIVAVPYREYFPMLLKTFCQLKLQATTNKEFQILLGYTPRHACEQDFFRDLESRGFTVQRITDDLLHEDFRGDEQIQVFKLY